MKIKTENKEIEMKEPKGKHIKKYWNFLGDLETLSDKEAVSTLKKFIIFQDELVSELTGLTVDELDDMIMSDKQKFIDVIQGSAMNMLDFTRLSPKLANLSERATQK